MDAPQVASWIDLDDPTVDETPVLARRLREGQELAHRLRSHIDALTLELAARMDADVLAIAGVGIVRRGYTRRSQWKDNEASVDLRRDVGDVVCKAVATDVGTGEIDPVRRNMARAAVDAMYEIIPAFSGIKATAKKYGLSIGEYRVFNDLPVITVDKEL